MIGNLSARDVIVLVLFALLLSGPLHAAPPEFVVKALDSQNVEYLLYSAPTAVAWSPASAMDESLLAIGTADGIVTLRKIPSGHEYLRLETGHRVPITDLSFSSNGRLLAASSPVEGFSTVWDLEKRSEVSLPGIRRAYLVIFSPTRPNTAAAVGPAGRITLGEIDGSDSLPFRTGQETIPTRLVWSEDGTEVLAAYPQIAIVGSATDAGKNRPIPCLARNGLSQSCGLATWAGTNGRQVLQVSSSDAGGQTSLMLEGRPILESEDPVNRISLGNSSAIAWSSSRELLLVGGSRISVLDITIFDKAIPLRPMGEPDVHYSKMSLDPSQTTVAVVASDESGASWIELWDLSSGAQIQDYLPGTLNGHYPNNEGFTASLGAATVGTIQRGQSEIAIWQESAGGPRPFRDPVRVSVPARSLDGIELFGLPSSVALSSDGGLIAVGHSVGRLSVWKRNGGQTEFVATGHELRFDDPWPEEHGPSPEEHRPSPEEHWPTGMRTRGIAIEATEDSRDTVVFSQEFPEQRVREPSEREQRLTTKITAIEFAEDSNDAWIVSSPKGQGNSGKVFPSSFVTDYSLLIEKQAILLPIVPGDVGPSFEPTGHLSALALSAKDSLAYGALSSRTGLETPRIARWKFDTSSRRAALDSIVETDHRCSEVLDIRITPEFSYVCPEGLSNSSGWLPLPLSSVNSARFFKGDGLVLGVRGHLVLAAIKGNEILPESLLMGALSGLPMKENWMVCALGETTCWGTDDGTLLVKDEDSLVVPFRREVRSRRGLGCAEDIAPVGQALRDGGNSHAFSLPIVADGYALWAHLSPRLANKDARRWSAVGTSKVSCLNCSISNPSVSVDSRLVLAGDWYGSSLSELRARIRWWNPCENGWHQSDVHSLPVAPPFSLPSFPDVELADIDGTLALKLSGTGDSTPFYHYVSLAMGTEESGILVGSEAHGMSANSGQSLHPLPWKRDIKVPIRVSSREAVPPYRSVVVVLNEQKPPFLGIAAVVVGTSILLWLLWQFLGRPHGTKAS